MKRTIAAIIMMLCILAASLIGCGNAKNNAGNGNESAPSNANNAADASTVQGMVIDTYAQGENLHNITDEASIKKAYDYLLQVCRRKKLSERNF